MPIIILLILSVILAIAYLLQSSYLNFKINYLINLVYDTNRKYSEKLKNTISKDIFERLNYRKDWYKKTSKIIEEHYGCFPVALYSRYYCAYKKLIANKES